VPSRLPDALADLLAPLLDMPARAAVVTDFDGTLSAIVDDPASAMPLPGVVGALHDLAARYRTVAVVSGRPVAFLRDRLELDGGRRPPTALVVSGLYGLERLAAGELAVHPAAAISREAVGLVAAEAEATAPRGVHVERKGLSVTLHVRTDPAHLDWARTWAEDAATRHRLVVHPGRMSFELRPPVPVDKGTVVDELVAGSDAACFLGDDLGDLPAFDALDRLAAAGAHVVRIGVRSDEAPPELLRRADAVVDGPGGALAVLRALAAC